MGGPLWRAACLMTTQGDTQRLGLFLPLRLATYIVIMAIVVGWMADPRYLHLPVIVYSLVSLAAAAGRALERRFNLARVTRILTALQFLIEIALETGIIYVTGNLHSPFSALFVLTIVSAALAYRMLGTLVVASTVSAAYAFVIWFGLSRGESELSVQALKTIFSSNELAFYGIFLHILIFYLIAFVSGYLAERLSRQDQQLKDASSALRRARLETDDILRHLNSGLLTVDPSGQIIYFNRAAERILGYREENVKGMPCADVFSERMPELANCLLDGVESRVAYPRRELDIVNLQHHAVPLGLSTSILTEDSGELRGVIAIFSDLTEAKELEQKARYSDRLAAVGELSASIAHEIRNPLAAISGSVEVLQRELELDGENHRLMALILKESQRLNAILTDFLAYARMGRPAYNKVELCHIVSDIRELLSRRESASPDINLEFNTDESIVYVVGDEDLIRQLIMNLAINAIEAFEGRPGRVAFDLECDLEGRIARLAVTDNGPGIDPGIIDRIYQPFFSTKKSGTGLGLAIVHRICSALKLSLELDSRPGQGTTFTVDFRRYVPERTGAGGQPEKSPARQPARSAILL
jgi:two-component system sensor histidine kinase PilS (NtrC family)